MALELDAAPLSFQYSVILYPNILLIVNKISPIELKGPLGAIHPFLFQFGILLSFLVPLPIPDMADKESFIGS